LPVLSGWGKIVDKRRRMHEIVNTLRMRNIVYIKELTKRFNVSDMTIRRDLNALAEDEVIDLIPGGAVLRLVGDQEDTYQVTKEESVHTIEKLRIGQKAASLIEPNDTVILDIGTTTEYIAKFLRTDTPVTVLCSTLNAVVELYKKKNCSIILASGYFHSDTMMFESPEGIELIRRTRADKVFVSAAGIHHDLGVTTVYPHELQSKKTILTSAKTRILVADSTKFGKTKSVYFSELSNFQIIISDSGLPDFYADLIREMGIELYIV
jgi:DeoR family deoxyribose operon repressor